MPRFDVDTRAERDHIESTVRQFLARYIQVKTINEGTASTSRLEEFSKTGFSQGEMSDLRQWELTVAIVLAHVDREIKQGACRATAHKLIRGIRKADKNDDRLSWDDIAVGLKVTIEEAKDIVIRTEARIFAEIIGRGIEEYKEESAVA